jgi:OOP family OmpA-OmpF porin
MRAVHALFVATALAAAPAFAEDDSTDGFYLGAGRGDFSTDIDDIGDVDEANLDFDSDQNASKFFAGWRFNRLVAVQIDRVDFERSVDASNAVNVLSTEADGFAPSVVGMLPLGPLELFARAGILWYDLEIVRDDMSLAAGSDRDSIFGAGVGLTIAERLSLRAEYEVVEIDGLDRPNAVWVTAAWRF